MGSIEEYKKKKRIAKQPTCKHRWLIGKGNGKFECVDCDIILDEVPERNKLAF